jgi:hypothetical protein
MDQNIDIRIRGEQGDQIGRIFAYWANFRLLGDCFIRTVFPKSQKQPNFWATIFSGNYICTNFNKKWLGLHFGRFF